jgi:hypothetical protein
MSRKHSTALGIGAAMGGAAVAAFLSMGMGMAHADDTLTPDGYTDLLGGGSLPQAADDASLDTQLFDNSAGNAAAFDSSVDNFQSSPFDHGLQTLINAIDPSAFTVQHDVDITGYLTAADGAGDAGGYLVPDDFLGYLATDLDYFLLTPTGLDPLALGAIIDTLLGSPPAF